MYAPSPGCTARCTTPGVAEVRPCGRRVGQGLLRAPSPSKNRTCEFPRIRLKPFCRPISRPGCWVVRVCAFHGREYLALGPSFSPALLPPHPTLAEVAFVRRIELRGFGAYFNMPANRHATRPEKIQVPPGTVPLPGRRREDPLLRRPGAEVSPTHPAFPLRGCLLCAHCHSVLKMHLSAYRKARLATR
jgi:hypothetical protein